MTKTERLTDSQIFATARWAELAKMTKAGLITISKVTVHDSTRTVYEIIDGSCTKSEIVLFIARAELNGE